MLPAQQSLESTISSADSVDDITPLTSPPNLLINSDALIDEEKQAKLLLVLDGLKNPACSHPEFDWSLISNTLLGIDISQHPRRLQDSENQLETLVKKYHEHAPDADAALAVISNNLFLLGGTALVKSDHKLLHDIALLEKIITKRRILRSPEYLQAQDYLDNFNRKYKSSTWEQILKYAIGFNAGLNTGSSFYTVMTSLFLIVPVIIVSGVFSLVLCLMIAHYFYNSYKDEDAELLNELARDEKLLTSLAYTESLLRLKCYKLISQKMALLQQSEPVDVSMIRDKLRLLKLIRHFKHDAALLSLDKFIDKKLTSYPKEMSRHNYRMTLTAPRQNSIYTRVFHSKYWGPALNFFGAAGTSFGVAKTILALLGVTALLGSPLALLGVLTGATVILGAIFAIKHLNFTLKTEEKKQYLKKFQSDNIKQLKIKSEQLRKFKNVLTTDLIYMNNKVNQVQDTQNVPALTTELIPIPAVMPQLTSSASLLAINGVFKQAVTEEKKMVDQPVARLALG
jgi:hypothetical protein